MEQRDFGSGSNCYKRPVLKKEERHQSVVRGSRMEVLKGSLSFFAKVCSSRKGLLAGRRTSESKRVKNIPTFFSPVQFCVHKGFFLDDIRDFVS